MNFIISTDTEIGVQKNVNQDCLSIKMINTPQGQVVFAVLCDGMGDLMAGKNAAKALVCAFEEWAHSELPLMHSNRIDKVIIREQWTRIVIQQNEKIRQYGNEYGKALGSTIVALLVTQTEYYCINIGNSRVYEFTQRFFRQITKDHTFVANEVECGRMTADEARVSKRRNILLQCVGGIESIFPDFFFGKSGKDCVYMICSDGLYNELTEIEMYTLFKPQVLSNPDVMLRKTQEAIKIARQRSEKDDISVALIRAYREKKRSRGFWLPM